MQELLNVTNVKTSIPKRPSRMCVFVDSLVKRMEKEIYDRCRFENRVSLNFGYDSGTIEIAMTSEGGCNVNVVHSENEHLSPTLEATIAGSMPDWWSIQSRVEEEESNEREFQDYLWNNCRY